MSSSPMLIIMFIYTFILPTAITARPATDGFSSNLANHIRGWTNDNSQASSTYAMVSNPSPLNAARSVSFETLNPPAFIQQKSSKSSGPGVNSTESDIPLFNASFPQKELKAVTVKYSLASRYLEGQGLSPLPKLAELSDFLGTDDQDTQATGSSFVWGLRTYGRDIAYYGQFNLGTRPQTVLLDVDTGSADLWVATQCTNCDSTKAQFIPSDSSTYSDTGQPFALAYGTGEVEGKLAQETVTLGPLSVHQQYFGAVSKESEDFASVPFVGIIGMAFSSISVSHQPTFMERLIQERQVDVAVFSVHLTRHQPRLSEVCIGCYDQSKYVGTIFWNPVISQTYWSISLNNIQVGGVNTSPRIVTAAIDTGTSLIYLPQDLADSLYDQIPGANRAPEYGPGLYTYPCTSRPTVSLVFGSQPHSINLQDFNLGMTTSSGRHCVGGILATGRDFSPNLAIIGDEFLKSWYSIYDYGRGSRVGFAMSINNRQP